ncbi:MAG TPA: protein kinase [Gemmatimonadaceae bacterium]
MPELRSRLESGLGAAYDIERELGGGGMARVFVATERALARRVVIKVLNPELAAGLSAKRFQREIQLAASLQQANIVPLLAAGETDGLPHYTMPFVEGLSLRERISRDQRLPLPEILGILRDVARALSYAHERGVVHRDIKPENVLLSGGAAVVTDFGIAKALSNARLDPESSAPKASTVTQAGTSVGTPAYMAPEQICADPAMDHRVDLYAFGCLSYELLAGQTPFGDRPMQALFSAHLSEPPLPLGERNPQCPPPLAGVVMQCLEKEPAARPATAQEILATLDTVTTAATPFQRFRQGLTRRQRVAAMGVLGIAVLGATALLVRSGTTLGPPRLQALAVLPIENLSGDSTQQYLADGMHEALIMSLSKLSGLRRVIARPSVLRYRRTDKTPAQIARELGVDALITGSWRSAGGRARVNVQLIAGATEQPLWSEQYDRDLQDLLALQDTVTRAIVGQIRVKLTPDEQSRLMQARSVNPEAHDAYLKGRFHWQRLTRQELETAERYFLQALEKDSSYALAYGGLGTVWALRCNLGIVPCREAIPQWKAAASKADELDPDAPEVQAQLAGIKLYAEWDWPGAERALQRAIGLDPSNPVLRVWYAEFLQGVAGRAEDGLVEMRRALELDPHNATQQAWVGQALLFAGRYDETIAYLQGLLERDPNAPLAHGFLQTAFERTGRYEDAMAVWRQTLRNREIADTIERAYAGGGYRGAMRLRAELAIRASQRSYVMPSTVARYYAAARENELAMDWLEKAYDEHEMQLVRLKGSPHWTTLHDEPRFQALLRRMAFP